jgi:hypothetical protein
MIPELRMAAATYLEGHRHSLLGDRRKQVHPKHDPDRGPSSRPTLRGTAIGLLVEKQTIKQRVVLFLLVSKDSHITNLYTQFFLQNLVFYLSSREFKNVLFFHVSFSSSSSSTRTITIRQFDTSKYFYHQRAM